LRESKASPTLPLLISILLLSLSGKPVLSRELIPPLPGQSPAGDALAASTVYLPAVGKNHRSGLRCRWLCGILLDWLPD